MDCGKFHVTHDMTLLLSTGRSTVYCKSSEVERFRGFRGSVGTTKLSQ